MITLNFTHKPSTKAILALPIQIKLQKGPCNKSYLHNYPFIFTIRSFFKQIKHMMHKINTILLCRHLGCHTAPPSLGATRCCAPSSPSIQIQAPFLFRLEFCFTIKPSTKALFTHPIPINYRKDLASNHIYAINFIFLK